MSTKAERIANLRLLDHRRAIIRKKWGRAECLTLDQCTRVDRQRVLSILGRFNLHPITWGLPEGRGYVSATLFLPLLDQEHFAYIAKSGEWTNLSYRGSGTRPSFLDACEAIHPMSCVKTFLYVGPDYSSVEIELQTSAGIRVLGTDPDHPVWFNRTRGDNDFLRRTPEQRSAAGRLMAAAIAERRRCDPEFDAYMREISRQVGEVTGPILGKRTAERRRVDPEFNERLNEAARITMLLHHERMKADPLYRDRILAVMNSISGLQRIAELRRTNPDFRENLRQHGIRNLKAVRSFSGLDTGPRTSPRYKSDPEYRRVIDSADPVRFWENWNLPRSDRKRSDRKPPPRIGRIVLVGVPHRMNPESVRGRLLRVVRTLEGRTVRDWFTYHRENREALRAGKDSGAILGIFCSAGFVSIVDDEGRVIFGRGIDEPTLRWTGGSWMRGRVRSRGPLLGGGSPPVEP